MALTTNSLQSGSASDLQNLGDLYHISSNAAIIEVGNQAVGLLTKFSINEDSGNTQIFEIGSPIATDITTGKLSVKVSGTLILSSDPVLYDGAFLPKTPFEIMAQSMAGIAFNIVVSNRHLDSVARDKTKGLVTAAEYEKSDADRFGFAKIENCRCSKLTTSVDSNKQIENNFEAIGQILQRSHSEGTDSEDVLKAGTGYIPSGWASKW